MQDPLLRPWPSALRWAGLLLGLAIGGFFDGILLHQVLQWHHLLSDLQVAALQDARAQLLADGLFHVLMYFVAAWGLWLLWKARASYARPGADRLLWTRALIGFGAWHVIDSIFSHWITGIHRIRVDSPDPLFWDLLWFAVFGVVPVVLGWWLGRGTPGRRDARTTPAALAITAALAAPLSALPAGESDQTLVMFRPGVSSASAFSALARVDARVLWVDRSGGLFAVQLRAPRAASALYRQGALLVSNSAFAAGCLAWTRASLRPART